MVANKLNDFDDFNYRDIGRSRVINIQDSGESFIVQAEDPYGFWYIKPVKGKTPVELSGRYTSFTEAERACKAYVSCKMATKPATKNAS